MILKIQSHKFLLAEKNMRCDAFGMWIDTSNNLSPAQLEKGISIWFNARKGIVEGEQYIYYEFVDEESGEILEMNCKIDMDAVMVKYKFYPKYILNCINNYFIKELNEKYE